MAKVIPDLLTPAGNTSEATGKQSGITVLVVEDNPVEAHLLRSVLAKAGTQGQQFGSLNIICVELLADALDRVVKESLDVVLLDLSLPDSVGLETLRRFREQNLSLPVVVLTGTDDESLAIEAVQIGAQDYLVKGQTNGRDVIRAVRYAVERHRLQQNLSLIDELTGLYNRRGFMMLAQQHLKTLSRNNDESLLFFADMDGLKRINDVHGHHAGSSALTRIAEALKSTFRDSDIVARLGGDEFVAIATHAGDENIETITARLHEKLQQMNASRTSAYELSLSVGAVRMTMAHNGSLEDFLAAADAAMYTNKQQKRAARIE
jgi:two-component system, cell cycle response regulator